MFNKPEQFTENTSLLKEYFYSNTDFTASNNVLKYIQYHIEICEILEDEYNRYYFYAVFHIPNERYEQVWFRLTDDEYVNIMLYLENPKDYKPKNKISEYKELHIWN